MVSNGNNNFYLRSVPALKRQGVTVLTGRFQAMMDVILTNQGPVTLILDSRKLF